MSRIDMPVQKRDPAGVGQVLALVFIVLLAVIFLPVTLLIVAVFLTKDFGPDLLHAAGRKLGRRWAQ